MEQRSEEAYVVSTITVIVPTYNESENIAELARRVHQSVPSATILVMDDSPDDKTAQAARQAGCQVVKRTRNRGLSKAVIEGIQCSRDSDIIFVMDGDLQHPPEVLPKMVMALESHELVVGSRWVEGGGAPGWDRKRLLISKVANLLAWPLAPRVKDRTSGFFGFRRSVVNPTTLNSTGWKIGLEVMTRGHYTKAAEVPYVFVPRGKGESKMSRKQLMEYLSQLVSLYLNKFRILNFMFVGGIGYAVNLVVYWLLLKVFAVMDTTFLGQHFYLPPFVISSFLAIVNNYLLNKRWTFRGWGEHSVGFLRYLSMGLVTLVFDMAILYLLVDFGKLTPVLAGALAIAIVYIIRYTIAKRWIWSKKPS